MMVEELKGTGEWEDETAYLTQLIVTWKELGGGNYQLYIMWH